ncbi:hypothetical protein RB3841 [Rhodopirellula baltica SH 1]|uniref:Uncharacterized protein n=1 Tax=Rhodopirellula baltica (strain DSM 10527 / NCIMB 13988 / SH1) TaxID=243090 RepID=Q7UTJ7_RHOBA|nr:hypothetical protein RB3841 [Rhodopirellula baltica SH 1]
MPTKAKKPEWYRQRRIAIVSSNQMTSWQADRSPACLHQLSVWWVAP